MGPKGFENQVCQRQLFKVMISAMISSLAVFHNNQLRNDNLFSLFKMHLIFQKRSVLFQPLFRSAGIETLPSHHRVLADDGGSSRLLHGWYSRHVASSLRLCAHSWYYSTTSSNAVGVCACFQLRKSAFSKLLPTFPEREHDNFSLRVLSFSFSKSSSSSRGRTFPLQIASHPYSVVLYTTSRTDGSHSFLLNYAQTSLVSESEGE